MGATQIREPWQRMVYLSIVFIWLRWLWSHENGVQSNWVGACWKLIKSWAVGVGLCTLQVIIWFPSCAAQRGWPCLRSVSGRLLLKHCTPAWCGCLGTEAAAVRRLLCHSAHGSSLRSNNPQTVAEGWEEKGFFCPTPIPEIKKQWQGGGMKIFSGHKWS